MKSKLSIFLIIIMLIVALCPVISFAVNETTFTVVFSETLKYKKGMVAGTTVTTIITLTTKRPLDVCKILGDKIPDGVYLYPGDTIYTQSTSTDKDGKVNHGTFGSLTESFIKDASGEGPYRGPFYGESSTDSVDYSGFLISYSENYVDSNGNWKGTIKNGGTTKEFLNSNPNGFKVLNPAIGTVIKDVNTNLTFSLKGYDNYKLVVQYFTSSDGISYSPAGFLPKYVDTVFNTVEGEDWLNYTIYGNELPWQNGYIKYKFILYKSGEQPSESKNFYEVSYKVEAQKSYVKLVKPQSASVEIPVITLVKYKYPTPVDYYINDKFYGTVVEATINKSILPRSQDCKIGTNTITVKRRDNSAVVVEDTFYLSANKDGEVEPNTNEKINDNNDKVDSDGKPKKPTGGNIIDWIIYAVNYTGWAIVTLGSSVSSLISSTANFGSLLQSWFYYLPSPYTQIMVIAVSLGIILRIFNR